MNELTLPSRHRIRHSNPGGLSPSTLPLGHEGYPQYHHGYPYQVDSNPFTADATKVVFNIVPLELEGVELPLCKVAV